MGPQSSEVCWRFTFLHYRDFPIQDMELDEHPSFVLREFPVAGIRFPKTWLLGNYYCWRIKRSPRIFQYYGRIPPGNEDIVPAGRGGGGKSPLKMPRRAPAAGYYSYSVKILSVNSGRGRGTGSASTVGSRWGYCKIQFGFFI